MKILCFLFFLIFAAASISADITGEWWRYNEKAQNHDHLLIDKNLHFLLELTIAGKSESFEGIINIIGDEHHYTQIIYGNEIKNCYIYVWSSHELLSVTIYKNESDTLFYGRFEREKTIPSSEEKPESKFGFIFTCGTTGGIFERTGSGQNEYLLSADIYSLYFKYLPAGLEFEVIPAKYFYNFCDQSHMMTFLNAGLYWDTVNYITKDSNQHKISFGPVFSVNWLNLRNFDSFDVNNIIFTTGLKFRYGLKSGEASFLILESGYKNIAGEHRFYFTARIDNFYPVIVTFGALLMPVIILGDWD